MKTQGHGLRSAKAKAVYKKLREADYPIRDALYAARGFDIAWDADLHFTLQDEDEPWDGEPPAPRYLFWAAVWAPEDWDERFDEPKREAVPLDSVGMIGVNSLSDPYLLYEEGSMYQNATPVQMKMRDPRRRRKRRTRARKRKTSRRGRRR